MLAMQTLGLSESTPRTENRLKSLFWPSIQTGTDVDYLGTQGYWVCAIVSVISFLTSVALNPLIAVLSLCFFFFGGVGVRERSRYAAVAVFVLFFINMLLAGIGVVGVLLSALLLSNVRATWMAHGWKPDSEDAKLPARLSDTWADKFADKLPTWLWPKVRYPYYVFSAFILISGIIGLLTMHHR
jgi:hypothetical protein